MRLGTRILGIMIIWTLGIWLQTDTAFAQTTNMSAKIRQRSVQSRMPASQEGTIARPCRVGPLTKNLMTLSTPPCDPTSPSPRQLTRKQLREIIKHPRTGEDYARVARYHKAEADRLDAIAASYEEAAATSRNGPIAKNLMAPNTSQRYADIAQTFRKKAEQFRKRALSEHEAANHGATIVGVE